MELEGEVQGRQDQAQKIIDMPQRIEVVKSQLYRHRMPECHLFCHIIEVLYLLPQAAPSPH